jgi:lipoprotein signal peptidase
VNNVLSVWTVSPNNIWETVIESKRSSKGTSVTLFLATSTLCSSGSNNHFVVVVVVVVVVGLLLMFSERRRSRAWYRMSLMLIGTRSLGNERAQIH